MYELFSIHFILFISDSVLGIIVALQALHPLELKTFVVSRNP